MRTRLIVVSTEGGSREDGNVYYSRYLIVSTDSLRFDEEIFVDADHPLRAYRQVINDDDTSDARMSAVANELTKLGYTVFVPEVDFIEVKTG